MVLDTATTVADPPAGMRTHKEDAHERWNWLCEHPQSARWWDWYALLRLLQAATPDHPRLGYGVQLADDPVRLGQPPFFHAAGSTVASLATNSGGEPLRNSGRSVPRLQSFHFGLFGPNGPLPLHLTEVAYRQSHAGVGALAAFCDIVHHRFLCYFFRAWADARKELELDREPESAREQGKEYEDRISVGGQRTWELYLGSLIGFGTHALRNRDHVPDRAKLFQAGRLMRNSHNSEGLQAILEEYFEAPVRITRFFPRTTKLPGGLNCRIGEGKGGAVGRLGLSVYLGQRYIDHQSGFRVRIGPVHLAQFLDFLPGSDGLTELHDWVRLYMGRETDSNPDAGLDALWDIQLVLFSREAPRSALGRGTRLGWTSWLHSKPHSADVDDLILRPPSTPPRRPRSRPPAPVAPSAA